MKCTQYYPVIQTENVADTADFYTKHFRFTPMFEADWYIHLQSMDDPKVNLAILQHDHPTVPVNHRVPTQGLILNFEVEDVDALYEAAVENGLAITKELVSEDFGQRHFMTEDPNGILIDVIKPIPPSAEFLEQYQSEAVPS